MNQCQCIFWVGQLPFQHPVGQMQFLHFLDGQLKLEMPKEGLRLNSNDDQFRQNPIFHAMAFLISFSVLRHVHYLWPFLRFLPLPFNFHIVFETKKSADILLQHRCVPYMAWSHILFSRVTLNPVIIVKLTISCKFSLGKMICPNCLCENH